MAVKVAELDLDHPFPSFLELDLRHYSHLQILVRKDRQPLGYTWIHARSKRFLAEDYIRFEIQRQLFDRLNRVEFERSLGDSMSLDAADYPWPDVTVAVCTRGRPESLDLTLRSLARLNYPEDKLDVLVVDNAPDDDATERVAARFPRIRYVVEPRPGLDWARNRAIREARAAIVAYTDDDVEVDPWWVRALVRHFENPMVMCVTGLVAPAERETVAQDLFEEYGGFGRGFQRRFWTLGVREHWRPFPLGAGDFGTGCNMAYHKALFDRIGPFDEALDVGTPTHGGGDLDMFYRTLRAGFVLVYEPQALVWHYHRRDVMKLRAQMRDWGRGNYAFWTKTFLSDRTMRWWTVALAVRWYRQRYISPLIRRKRMPRRVVMAEAIGAMQGPAACFIARHQARDIARGHGPSAHKVDGEKYPSHVSQ